MNSAAVADNILFPLLVFGTVIVREVTAPRHLRSGHAIRRWGRGHRIDGVAACQVHLENAALSGLPLGAEAGPIVQDEAGKFRVVGMLPGPGLRGLPEI